MTGLSPEQILGVMGRESELDRLKAATVSQAYDMLFRRAQEEARQAEAAERAARAGRGEKREERRLEIAESAEERAEREAERRYGFELTRIGLSLRGEERAEKAAERAERAAEREEKRLGLAYTKEKRSARAQELNDATKRIRTILDKYGEGAGFSWNPDTGAFSTTGGAGASYQALVTQARAGDKGAMADLKSVARDMYRMRAPEDALTRDFFTDEALEAIDANPDKTITLRDYDGVIIKVKKSGNMIKIVEVVG